jgi:hypothetical protein
MSLHPEPLPPIPDATAAAVRAAFPKGNLYMDLRTEFGTLYNDQLFVDLYPSESLFEKYQAASRLSIKRVIATYTKVSLVVGHSSSSLLNRQHWFNQAKVLSTTQRCGNTAKPFCPSARAPDSRTIRYFALIQAAHSAPR